MLEGEGWVGSRIGQLTLSKGPAKMGTRNHVGKELF